MTKLPLFTVVLIVLLLSTLTVADIKSLTISNDFRPLILFQKFRFTQTGHITISASSVSLSSPTQDSSRLGFFLLSDESFPEVLLELQHNLNFCVLDSHYILRFFTFLNLSPSPRSNFNYSYQVTSPNEYAIFFENCVHGTTVSMKITTELFNLDRNGLKDYSPPGSTHLPGLYFIYLSFFTLWVYFCRKSKHVVRRVHFLMTCLVLSKALCMFCVYAVTCNVKFTGMAHGWNVVLYVFRFMEDVLLFVVIVLLGKGWSLLKPNLQGKKKKKLLMIVVLFRVLANVSSVVIGETGPYIENWVIWNQVYLLADLTSCCAVMFTMVWTICCSLRRETSKTDGRTVKNLAKLPLFRRFYVLVVVYLVFTRIGVFVLKVIAAYEYEWVSNVAEEIASLVFYVSVFYMFRPMEWNDQFCVDDDEEEASEVALKKEELEL